MEQQITSGTQSANVTIDLTRLDKEYLVQIRSWFWIVFMTQEAAQALSDRLSDLSVKGILKSDEHLDSTWGITCIGEIRSHREPFSIDEYLNSLGKEARDAD